MDLNRDHAAGQVRARLRGPARYRRQFADPGRLHHLGRVARAHAVVDWLSRALVFGAARSGGAALLHHQSWCAPAQGRGRPWRRHPGRAGDRRGCGVRQALVPTHRRRGHADHAADDRSLHGQQVMIDVLSVASEAYPLIKTGGLADVTGALPGALASHGVTMHTLLPGYPAVMGAIEDGRALAGYPDFFGGPAELIAGRAKGLDIIALKADHLYGRPGTPNLRPDRKDWPDNWRRFAALSFAAHELGRGASEAVVPDILHCHDWQAGLVPAY